MKRMLCSIVVLLALAVPANAARKHKKAASDVAVASKILAPADSRLRAKKQVGEPAAENAAEAKAGPVRVGPPVELRMTKAHGKRFDLRTLPRTPPVRRERPERKPPRINPRPLESAVTSAASESASPLIAAPTAVAPAPLTHFAGLDFLNWGAGHPPDTNGDVGPQYYIQTINTSLGIYDKSTGVNVASFTFDTFMSQGSFGNLCDTDNFGDPVVLYDSFEDRWIVTDFAFQLDGSDNVVNPPGSFQCIAVSMTGDPVTGGWNFYSINTTGGLGDYPKFGIWPDGLYMSVNMFDYAANGGFQNARVYAFNKQQMYAGTPSVQVVSFDLPPDQFTVLPANARLQAGTPPAGRPNLMASVGANFLNAMEVWKFHVDWDHLSASSVTGPSYPTMALWWEQYNLSGATTAPTPANALDTLYPRTMVQNQYTNLSGVESIWTSHTVGAGNPTSNLTSAQSAVRFYQLNVTGGAIAAQTTQHFTYSPDTTLFRYMPSVAVDRFGDMAIGYSTSSAAANPSIVYAGRLAGDPLNTITQTEQTLIGGTGSQSGSCGGTCERWGDYSAMTLDPDGCTFWYTNQYYITTGLDHQTRIGAFAFPSCTKVGAGGSISGTVTVAVVGTPLGGATVQMGSRSTTTNRGGAYSFNDLPAGTYPAITASLPGSASVTNSNVAVADGSTTTSNFSLPPAASAACLTDTTQLDFSGDVTTLDLTTSLGDARLSANPVLDQQNATLSNSGLPFNTSWRAQTFTPAISGPLTSVTLNLFSLTCTGITMPDITVSIRNATLNQPSGSDLAVATIPGFCNGAGANFTATFATPPAVSAATQYAIIWRTATAPTGSAAYYATVSSADPYAAGHRCVSSDGASWTCDTSASQNDHGFQTFVSAGFASSGDLVSTTKDGNPSATAITAWSTLSWVSASPPNTTVKFQLAGSNSPTGPFNFVGPDGTAATYFTTSPAAIAQFTGLRYLKYHAYLSTTDNAATPTLSDVVLCYTSSARPAAPTSVVATAAPAGTSVSIQWIASAGATGGYRVFRRAAGTGYVQVGPVTSSVSMTDNSVTAGKAYLYVVRAIGAGGVESADSNGDLATTVVFTEPIVRNTTTMKATQINEIRQAVRAVRDLARRADLPFTDNPLAGVPVKKLQIDQLRAWLEDALSQLLLPPVSYTDGTITINTTPVRLEHVTELRAAVQ